MATDITANGNIELEEEARTQTSSFFDSLEAVNLDEVTTSTVRVAFRDSRLVPQLEEEGNPLVEEGKPKMRRQFYTRIAEIENYVPMSVFNKMMTTRSRALRLRGAFLASTTEVDIPDPIITWMSEQVLAVWKQTEEDMTLERLESGLEFRKISRLFTLFFGHLLPLSVR